MKPHRLALAALGPYPDEIEVDFDELVEEGLFLIHGTTGAGKTFLLDAMCFALYGEVPGERGKDSLQAKGADRSAKPWVLLEFSSQGDRWRVQRTPIHELLTTRGTVSTKGSSAALERLDGTTWTPVAQGVKDVTEQVQHLLGLTASQFQQVILLPQGRFEKVLRAGSDEREQLLQTLFDTEVFDRATWWLRDQATARRRAVEHDLAALGELRSRAAERWRSVAPEPPTEDEAPPADEPAGEPADQAQLDALVHSAQALADGVAAEAAAAGAELTRCQRLADEATDLAARWDRREGLRRRRAELAAAQEAVDADAATAATADAAEGLRQLLDDADARRLAAEQAEAAVTDALDELRARWADAPSVPTGVPAPGSSGPPDDDTLDELRTALGAHRVELEQVVTTIGQARAKTADAHRHRSAADAHQGAAAQARREHDASSAAREADETARLEAVAAADRLEGLTRLAEEAAERSAAAQELVGLRRQLTDAADRLRTTDEVLHQRRVDALDLRQRRLDGMAAELATGLVDDRPCPVCGATAHPSPAAPADDAVSADDVAAADRLVEAAREAEDAARRAHTELERRVAERRGQAGDTADEPERAAAEASSARTACDEAAALAATLDVVEARLAASATRLAELEAEAGAAEVAAADAAARAEEAERDADALRRQVTDAVGDLDPEAAIAAVDDVDAAAQALARAVRDRRDAVAAHEATTTSLGAALADSPFADTGAARAALLDPAERVRLGERIRAHQHDVVTVEHDLAGDDLADLPTDRPDPTGPLDEVTAAKARARAAEDRHALVAEAHRALAGWADEHRERDAALAGARAEAELWQTVADRCAGGLAPKISLQRWVLSAYLEEICGFANQRLATMTGARYSLSVHREGEKGGGKSGLGLRVHDTYNGAQRDVSTLSGGETFQASLCLALAVADAVAAHAGGVRLEALFVDEGFGTLDAEALQLAMDELDRLREGGRTVGLISHVAALRERIRVGIEVVPSEHGSTVRVGTVAPV